MLKYTTHVITHLLCVYLYIVIISLNLQVMINLIEPAIYTSIPVIWPTARGRREPNAVPTVPDAAIPSKQQYGVQE